MSLSSFFILSIFCAFIGLFLGELPMMFPGAAMSIFILLVDVMKRLVSLEEKMKEKNK